jgi:hypothetical protein
MPSHAKPDTEQTTESVEKPNEINGLQKVLDNREGGCYSMGCRRMVRRHNPNYNEVIMTKIATFTLSFEIPVNEVGVSPDGNYFNLPFYLRGGTFKHGKQECEAVISKGRVIIRTAKGREELVEETPKKAKSPKVDLANLF